LDLGGRRGMKHMLDYLMERPDRGLLGYQMGWPVIVQYWRSFDHLEAFANDTSDPHVAAWRNYWKRVGTTARTGIWPVTGPRAQGGACPGRQCGRGSRAWLAARFPV
jgi:hypothetical protein